MTNNDFQDKEYRDAFVDAMIRTGIAFQIKALRKREEMSQTELGESVNTPQNVISRYENPDYDAFTLKSLRRLASAFDVALIVKFATFRELRRLTEDRSPEALAVPSFSMEHQSLESSMAPQIASTANIVQTDTTDIAHLNNVYSLDDYRGSQRLAASSDVSEIKSNSTHQNRYSHGSC